MGKLIDLNAYPVQETLKILLQDKTTKQNIIWATGAYASLGTGFQDTDQITAEKILGMDSIVLQPRIEKAMEEQQERTRQRAEVMTPVWLCNAMNNHIDEQWFGRKDVFNMECSGNQWDVVDARIIFPEGKGWKSYVDSRRLEITCGEGPYLVSRYDTTTGEYILPPFRRIGILDRKLRIVAENTDSKEEWIEWAIRAFQSCFGFEYQGDSLLIARINMIMSFHDYYQDKWKENPDNKILRKIANIISWNLWQMDGLKDTVPHGRPEEENHQVTMFEWMLPEQKAEDIAVYSKIYDWRRDNSIIYKKLKERGVENMSKKLFDYVTGNPPYQQSGITNNKAEALYHYFYDAAKNVSDHYLLISPARFLFNAGLTPKDWNKKMLSDTHIKIEEYYANSNDVFSNVNINGGIAIVYYNRNEVFAPIGKFIPNPILRKIASNFSMDNQESLASIVFGGRSELKFNECFLDEFPNTYDHILKSLQKKHPEIKKLGPNEEYEIKSSSFERTAYAFEDEEPTNKEEYYKILGIEKGQRVYKWIKKKYLTPRYPNRNNIDKYKIMVSNADGAAGQIGKPIPARILGKPLVAHPDTTSIPTFMSIGSFKTKTEAENLAKYVQTRFVRVLIGIEKITQHITPSSWKYVPLQDFTNKSDINWSRSINEIDLQLYRKYNLAKEEIDFIETHVTEME